MLRGPNDRMSECYRRAATDAASGDGNGQMGLAGAVDQHGLSYGYPAVRISARLSLPGFFYNPNCETSLFVVKGQIAEVGPSHCGTY